MSFSPFENLVQINGTTVDTNSGNKSAGTLRVVLATDQPQNTTALKVDGSAVTQPVSGTVTTTPPSHASTNVDQLNGTTTDTNSGSKSAGTLRVVLATDQPQLTNKLLVTPDANSAVNVAQINGITPLMGNGTTGTGSQRVTIASDNTAFSVNTTAKAATSGGLGLPFSASVNATKQQVKGTAGQVYGWSILNTTSAIAYC